MSAMLPGLGPPASLRLPVPAWGIDTSTLRMSCAGLLPLSEADAIARGMEAVTGLAPAASGPKLVWDTLSLPTLKHLAARQAAAVRVMCPWLARLEERWGRPEVIGYEAPLAGGNTPLPSFYVVGALLVAIGEVFEGSVALDPWSPSEWKKVATGAGYIRGLPKAMPKAEKRRAEKARLVEWAQGVGYTGELDDEADSVGVATATGVRLCARLRT